MKLIPNVKAGKAPSIAHPEIANPVIEAANALRNATAEPAGIAEFIFEGSTFHLELSTVRVAALVGESIAWVSVAGEEDPDESGDPTEAMKTALGINQETVLVQAFVVDGVSTTAEEIYVYRLPE